MEKASRPTLRSKEWREVTLTSPTQSRKVLLQGETEGQADVELTSPEAPVNRTYPFPGVQGPFLKALDTSLEVRARVLGKGGEEKLHCPHWVEKAA